MPPARAPLLPTPRLCKSSRPPALSVRLPWRAVLLSAPSKHCARRRLLAHTPKAAGPAGWLPAPSSLSPPNAPAGRTVQLSKRSARCVGRESNPGQLLGRQLCSPLYHQRYTARAASGRRPRARPSIRSPPPPPPPPPHPCPDAPSAGGSAPPPAPPAAARRPMRASATPLRGPPARRPCGPPALRSPPRPANASALSPGGQRGARSFPHPAGQKSPSPPGAGRRHFPRRLGDTGPSCLHASRRCAEPHGGGVASLGAH